MVSGDSIKVEARYKVHGHYSSFFHLIANSSETKQMYFEKLDEEAVT